MHRANVALFLVMIGLLGLAPIALAAVYLARKRTDARQADAAPPRSPLVSPIAVVAAVVVVLGATAAWAIAGRAMDRTEMATSMSGTGRGIAPAAGAPATDVRAPAHLVGQAMSSYMEGPDAVAEVQALHAGRFTIVDAWIATYGDGRVTVWRSEADGLVAARRQVNRMQRAISRIDSPFEPAHLLRVGVYATTGMGQVHYFFSRGRGVWWLAADLSIARPALTQLLEVAG